MLNEIFTITPFSSSQSLLSWSTQNATDVSYIFINGSLVINAFRNDATDRQILVPLQIKNGFIIEIHDFLVPESSVLPITEISNKMPLIEWNYVEAAVKYRIYADSKLLYTIIAQTDLKNYSKQILNTDFYGKIATWYFFTVTSIDMYGNESLLKYFPHYIYDIPPLITNLVVSNGSGSGLYDLTITL